MTQYFCQFYVGFNFSVLKRFLLSADKRPHTHILLHKKFPLFLNTLSIELIWGDRKIYIKWAVFLKAKTCFTFPSISSFYAFSAYLISFLYYLCHFPMKTQSMYSQKLCLGCLKGKENEREKQIKVVFLHLVGFQEEINENGTI